MTTQAAPQRFLITTPGLSATRWLSFALATHPEVFVAHGKHPLHSVIHGDLAREQNLDDAESITDGNRMAEFYEKLSLEVIFAVYQSVKLDARAAGNVHTFTLHTLMDKVEQPGELNGVKVINVLRHPVNYINSHTSLVRSSEGHELYRHYEQDMMLDALAKFPELMLITCDDHLEFVAFAVSCFSVHNLERDLGQLECESIQMEALTRDADVLRGFCEELTGLTFDPARLEAMISEGAINTHKRENASRDPRAIFESWAPWQQDIARMMIPPAVLEMFEANGYDVGMFDLAVSQAIPTEAVHDFTPGCSFADYLMEHKPRHKGLALIFG